MRILHWNKPRWLYPCHTPVALQVFKEVSHFAALMAEFPRARQILYAASHENANLHANRASAAVSDNSVSSEIRKNRIFYTALLSSYKPRHCSMRAEGAIIRMTRNAICRHNCR